jgi:hypothetical protein
MAWTCGCSSTQNVSVLPHPHSILCKNPNYNLDKNCLFQCQASLKSSQTQTHNQLNINGTERSERKISIHLTTTHLPTHQHITHRHSEQTDMERTCMNTQVKLFQHLPRKENCFTQDVRERLASLPHYLVHIKNHQQSHFNLAFSCHIYNYQLHSSATSFHVIPWRAFICRYCDVLPW